MKYAILFLLIAAMAACNKKQTREFQTCTNNCFIISGRLTDGLYALPNVELKLRYREAKPPFGMRTTYIGNTVTDESGLFEFKFSSEDYKYAAGTYEIIGYKDGYFAFPYSELGGDSIILDDIMLDTTKIDRPLLLDAYFYKTAWLGVKLKDTATHTVYVDYYIGKEDYSAGTLNTTNPSGKHKAAANVPTIIKWRTYGDKGGIERKGADTIVLKEGEEHVYEIKP